MRLKGTVVDDSDRPLEGLLVRAYDKDLLKDDHLGDANTDAAGNFEITYTDVQFRDFNETLPDLYIRVYDTSGKRLLYTTEKAVRKNVRGLEVFDVKIARDKLAGA